MSLACLLSFLLISLFFQTIFYLAIVASNESGSEWRDTDLFRTGGIAGEWTIISVLGSAVIGSQLWIYIFVSPLAPAPLECCTPGYIRGANAALDYKCTTKVI
jgi:hypothetical protein